MADGKNVRIILWCVPRTISTALTKCLSAIDGMEIWFEPYFYCDYNKNRYREDCGDVLPTGYEGNEDKAEKAARAVEVHIPGANIIPQRILYGSMKRLLESTESRYVLVKDFALAMQDENTRQYIPARYRHVFVIRHPTQVFSSLRKAYYDHYGGLGLIEGEGRDEEKFDFERDNVVVKANELYSGQHDLWKYVRENIDPNTIVLNMDDLLASPGQVLSKLCEQVELPYSESLLRWDESKDRMKLWKAAGSELIFSLGPFYNRALESSAFGHPKTSVPFEELSPDVQRLATAALPYFEEMDQHKL